MRTGGTIEPCWGGGIPGVRFRTAFPSSVRSGPRTPTHHLVSTHRRVRPPRYRGPPPVIPWGARGRSIVLFSRHPFHLCPRRSCTPADSGRPRALAARTCAPVEGRCPPQWTRLCAHYSHANRRAISPELDQGLSRASSARGRMLRDVAPDRRPLSEDRIAFARSCHEGILARENQSCCSINPEVRAGLKGSREKSIGMQRPWIDEKVSAARSSARLMRSSSGPAVFHVATHRAANASCSVRSPDGTGVVGCMWPACRIGR